MDMTYIALHYVPLPLCLCHCRDGKNPDCPITHLITLLLFIYCRLGTDLNLVQLSPCGLALLTDKLQEKCIVNQVSLFGLVVNNKPHRFDIYCCYNNIFIWFVATDKFCAVYCCDVGRQELKGKKKSTFKFKFKLNNYIWGRAPNGKHI